MKTLSATSFRKIFSFVSEYILVLLGLLLLGMAGGCRQAELKDKEPAGNSYDAARKITTHYGPAVPVGGGIARTFVTVTKEGRPASVGVALSEKALTALPQHMHGDHGSTEFVLQFPRQAELTPFRCMTLDWSPHGHEPQPVYTRAHFDFHFYMISDQVRQTIPGLPPGEMDAQLPPPGFMPAVYVPTPGRIPAMGTHWVDVTSPELSGGEFTQTFIYGTYQHKVVFYEPMVTLDYLLSRPQATIPVQQPQFFGQAGYYPLNYRIEYDAKAKEYRVALIDLTQRQMQ
jgi:hypothetical protein